MGSRTVKGLLKGLRCISQIFDEEKEAEMKIGMPTDVKHVAHIGWDGPSADAPTWMKGFESSGEGNNQDVQKAPNSFARDQPDVPKSTRRVSSKDNPSSSPKKGKSRSKHHSKDSKKDSKRDSKNTKSNQDGNVIESDSTAGEHAKKSRRKKSKDSGSSRSSKSRGSSSGSGSDFPDQEIAPNM